MQGYLNHRKMAYTIDEVGELISLSRAQIYRLIESGEINSICIGKARRITYAQLDAFVLKLEQYQGFARL